MPTERIPYRTIATAVASETISEYIEHEALSYAEALQRAIEVALLEATSNLMQDEVHDNTFIVQITAPVIVVDNGAVAVTLSALLEDVDITDKLEDVRAGRITMEEALEEE